MTRIGGSSGGKWCVKRGKKEACLEKNGENWCKTEITPCEAEGDGAGGWVRGELKGETGN